MPAKGLCVANQGACRLKDVKLVTSTFVIILFGCDLKVLAGRADKVTKVCPLLWLLQS
jgi:hypothetical protein